MSEIIETPISLPDAARTRSIVVEALQEHGLQLPHGSRFDKYLRLLSTVEQSVDRATDLPFETLWPVGYATRELDQLLVILMFPIRDGYAHWVKKLRRILAGPPLPRRPSSHSLPYDTQFELLLAACGKRSNLGVSIQEPDVRLVWPGGNSFVIAAKRPASSKKVFDHYRKGQKQIQASEQQGYVFFDWTECLYELSLESYLPTGSVNPAELVFDAVDYSARWITARIRAKRLRVSDAVRGIVVFGMAAVRGPTPPFIRLHSRWSAVGLHGSESQREADSLMEIVRWVPFLTDQDMP